LIVVIIAAVIILVGSHTTTFLRDAPLADSTDALQSQFDALKPGGILKLDPQLYLHHGVITLRVPDVRIDGNGATFQATNDETSSVQITADRVQLTNLNLTAATEGKRWEGLDQHKLVVSGDQDTLTHISIVGSAAAGIFVHGAQNFRIEDVSISGTRADGIHMTGGSGNGVVDNVRTDQTGDDGIAVVSYDADIEPCHDILVSQTVVTNSRARGITVVGGRNVTIRGFSVSGPSAAGIYVASEGDPYYTQSVESVTVSGGSVSSANQDSGIVHGAILLYAGNAGKYVRDVQISDVKISATPAWADRDVGIVIDAGSVGGISLKNISIDNSNVPVLYSDAPAGSITASGWTQDGKPIQAD
jgi:Right handed beta helix region